MAWMAIFRHKHGTMGAGDADAGCLCFKKGLAPVSEKVLKNQSTT